MSQLFFNLWPLWLFVLLAALLLLANQCWAARRTLPYDRRGALLTKAEQRFYHALLAAAGDRYAVLAMVRLADLLRVREAVRQRQTWQNRINCKHIDFVLCDPLTLDPAVCVELDDASHDQPARQERDAFVNEALAAAKLPLVRVRTAKTYDAAALRDQLETATK